jgi:hypothetical protein
MGRGSEKPDEEYKAYPYADQAPADKAGASMESSFSRLELVAEWVVWLFIFDQVVHAPDVFTLQVGAVGVRVIVIVISFLVGGIAIREGLVPVHPSSSSPPPIPLNWKCATLVQQLSG